MLYACLMKLKGAAGEEVVVEALKDVENRRGEGGMLGEEVRGEFFVEGRGENDYEGDKKVFVRTFTF